jgi:hypothetical protein
VPDNKADAVPCERLRIYKWVCLSDPFELSFIGGDTMAEKTFKQVCECKNCGNEAEMIVTCSLEEHQVESAKPHIVAQGEGKTKGHAVCSHCGGEADIWLDV